MVDVESEEVKRAKSLEVEAVNAAESGDLTRALSLLTEAITTAPHYPSSYNNRAQVWVLKQLRIRMESLPDCLSVNCTPPVKGIFLVDLLQSVE